MSGEWGIGISTPPSCILLDGENGEPIEWYATGDGTGLDGGRFQRALVRDPEASASRLDPGTEYYVRCRVSVDTGKTIEDTAPVLGQVPAS